MSGKKGQQQNIRPSTSVGHYKAHYYFVLCITSANRPIAQTSADAEILTLSVHCMKNMSLA